MKKLSILTVLIAFMLSSVMAQDFYREQLKLKKVEKGETPDGVLKAVEKDFKNLKTVEHALLPIKKYNQEWAISESKIESKTGSSPDFYRVIMKGSNYTMSAVYDKNGNLMRSREVRKNFPLPVEVRNTIGNEYEGWVITEDREVVRTRNGRLDYFKVYLEKGNDKKTVYIDDHGKIIRVKDRLIGG